MNRQQLHHGWTLTSTAGPVPATISGQVIPAQVPGSVHLDLLSAGLIPDPYVDLAEEELAWAHRASWQYALELAAGECAPDERVDLVFDGLDTVATITLNDVVLGRTANMHRGYRFDVRPTLVAGANQLTVDFRSALEHAEEVERSIGKRPHTNTHPYNMVRKMACSFGWDWGPDFQTAGIWKPVRLERWSTARLAQVRPLVTVDSNGAGRVEVHVEVERAGVRDAADLDLARGCRAASRRDHSGRRNQRCRGGQRAERRPVVAGRLRRPPAVRPGRLADLRPAGAAVAAGHLRPQDWFPHRLGRHHPRRDRHPVHLRGQRPAHLRQGRQLDPG